MALNKNVWDSLKIAVNKRDKVTKDFQEWSNEHTQAKENGDKDFNYIEYENVMFYQEEEIETLNKIITLLKKEL